jgi:hypothetical protein
MIEAHLADVRVDLHQMRLHQMGVRGLVAEGDGAMAGVWQGSRPEWCPRENSVEGNTEIGNMENLAAVREGLKLGRLHEEVSERVKREGERKRVCPGRSKL